MFRISPFDIAEIFKGNEKMLQDNFQNYSTVLQQIYDLQMAMMDFDALFASKYLKMPVKENESASPYKRLVRFSVCKRRVKDNFPQNWSANFVATKASEGGFRFSPIDGGWVEQEDGSFQHHTYPMPMDSGFANLDNIIFFEFERDDYFVGKKKKFVVHGNCELMFSGTCIYKQDGIEYAGNVEGNVPCNFGRKIIRCGKALESAQMWNEIRPIVEIHQIAMFFNGKPIDIAMVEYYQSGRLKWEPTYNGSQIMYLDENDCELQLCRKEMINYDKGIPVERVLEYSNLAQGSGGQFEASSNAPYLYHIQPIELPYTQRSDLPALLYTPRLNMKCKTERFVPPQTEEYYSVMKLLGFATRNDENGYCIGKSVEHVKLFCVHDDKFSMKFKQQLDKSSEDTHAKLVIVIYKVNENGVQNFETCCSNWYNRQFHSEHEDQIMFEVYEDFELILKNLPNDTWFRIVVARRMVRGGESAPGSGPRKISIQQKDLNDVDFLYSCQIHTIDARNQLATVMSLPSGNAEANVCDMLPDHMAQTQYIESIYEKLKQYIQVPRDRFDELCLRAELLKRNVDMRCTTIGFVTDPPLAFSFCIGAIVFVLETKIEHRRFELNRSSLVWFYNFNIRSEIESKFKFAEQARADLPVFDMQSEIEETSFFLNLRNNFLQAQICAKRKLNPPMCQADGRSAVDSNFWKSTLLLPESCICELKSFSQ